MTMQITLAANAPQLLNKANVVGVGVGYKTKGGRRTPRLSLTVLVEQKVPLAELGPADIVPAFIAGYPTDVVASGAFQALSVAPNLEIAAPGMSIGHYRITAGTFGAVVFDATTGAQLILSNNHVLANSSNGRDQRAFIGDPILQPGPIDGGQLPESLIATLLRYQPLNFLSTSASRLTAALYAAETRSSQPGSAVPLTNIIDAAVAKPLANALVTPEIKGIGQVTGTREAELDLPLQKSGRTTGVTTGSVLLLNAVVRVSYGSAGTAIFTDQVVSDIASGPGDSGSLVVDSERKAVGLLFAGGDNLTVCNRIAQVERLLDVQMLASR